nr:unnamed protein product [Callosobruchus chinensis]
MKYTTKIKSLPHHLNAHLFSDQSDYILRLSTTRPARIRSMEFANKYGIRVENILHNLPPSMEPWIRPSFNINLYLTTYPRQETSNSIYISAFAHQISNLPNDLVIYTDGSKTPSGTAAAIVVEEQSFSWTLDNIMSIYSAESFAIWQALLYFGHSSKSNCVIASDSLSVLQAIQNPFPKDASIIRIIEQIITLESHGKKVHLIWTPGHVGITRNERADAAAREAAALDRIDDGIPVPVSDIIKNLKVSVKRVWQTEWDQYGGHLKHTKSRVDKWYYPNNITRKQQVLLCRLRIGHTNLTYLYLLSGGPRPLCRQCNERLTVTHILVSCPIYSRIKLVLGITDDIPSILSNDETALRKLLLFLRHANLYFQI